VHGVAVTLPDISAVDDLSHWAVSSAGNMRVALSAFRSSRQRSWCMANSAETSPFLTVYDWQLLEEL
jgi:hypothetical protein